MAYPIETLMVNSQGTKNLLDFAKEKKASFLYASSSEIYGDPTISPQSEDCFGNVNPIGPRSVYDEGKRFGESLCMTYYRKFGLNVRIARIFNTYGEEMQKDDGRVVSNFINGSLSGETLTIDGDGSQTRSFCYVSDMVDGIFKAMFSDDTNGEIFNLGNPDEYTVKDLAHKIIDLTGSKSEIKYSGNFREDDPMRRQPDITKAKKILNWEPVVNLDEGLRKTIEYYKSL